MFGGEEGQRPPCEGPELQETEAGASIDACFRFMLSALSGLQIYITIEISLGNVYKDKITYTQTHTHIYI